MSYKDEICEKLNEMGYEVDKKLRNSIRPETGSLILDLIQKVGEKTPPVVDLKPLEQRVYDAVDDKKNVGELVESLGYDMTDSAYSSVRYALRRLREMGLIDFRREWKRRIYFKR